ncbi:hypothetical protein P872_07220 [Rhodonellum psychrophilum GCM71 = DSM 17998]|uniref:Uncharacterized protein n=1 Tax=Rhodonellum psychrophilum GCM71 = DSM 17998 TaxID=1123057 RepID=U5BNR4_9BACT|nr:hypothetical protein P872_07220 [Rhodonellum psychrophilum GCM71 = DSM 17998]
MWDNQSKAFILLQSLVPHVPLFWQPPLEPVSVEQLVHPAIFIYIQKEQNLLVNLIDETLFH